MKGGPDLAEIAEIILHLRAAEGTANPETRVPLAEARELLETIAGSTVRPASAARLLGVSQPALKRWLDRGDIATVLTPDGRREIPLPELLDLLEDIRQPDLADSGRPLAAVLRRRKRSAEEAVDLDRLLPRRGARTHRAPELQALAYHRLVAERLDDPLVEDARRRIGSWERNGRIHPHWAAEWNRLLTQPLPRIARAISADTPAARELRQTSPFAGALNEHERRRLVDAVERRVTA
jgi:hypothetical protein